MTSELTWSRSRWPAPRLRLMSVTLAFAVLTDVLVALDTGGLLRPFVVFIFLLSGPGLAFTGCLRFDSIVTEIVVAAPLSMALGVVVATAMSSAQLWRPDVALILMSTGVVAVLALQLRAQSVGLTSADAQSAPPRAATGRSRGRG
jgi:hypothetical protein